jgi:hypothetical protein
MTPKYHIIYGIIVSVAVYFLFDVDIKLVFIFWLFSWFVPDLDHYFEFCLRYKSLDFKNFYNISIKKRNEWKKLSKLEKSKYRYGIMFFHSIEFLLVLFLFGYFNVVFIYMAMGIIFHDIFDIIDYFNRGESIFVKLSLIYTIIYNKNRKSFK